jgi:hypothetical protein
MSKKSKTPQKHCHPSGFLGFLDTRGRPAYAVYFMSYGLAAPRPRVAGMFPEVPFSVVRHMTCIFPTKVSAH